MTPSTLPHRSPRAPRHRLAATGVALAVVLSLAACGTADQPEVVRPPETNPPATAAREEAGAATTVPSTSGTTRPPSTAPSTSSTTAASSTTSSSSPASSTSSVVVAADNLAFCQSFEAGLRRLSSDNSAVKVGDAEGEARLLAQAKVFFSEMAALAPPAIASDWATLNGVVQAAATPSDVAQPDGAGQTAADNIEVWTKANCGFDPGSIG